MCGILGVLDRHGAPIDAAVLARMMDVQRHRGPDDQGMRLFSLRRGESRDFDGPLPAPGEHGFEGGLGFNRLSILDLSRNGHQPMANADGSVMIVFNGEVYNAFDYKDELRAAGFSFRSNSDTEVILNLYQRHGLEGTLERLNGMFALCIVDLRRGSLFLVRDRLGIKPLYWTEVGGSFLFSSEAKAFLEHPEFVARLDDSLVDEQLVFRYCSGAGFPLAGVHQLEPAHWLELRSDALRVQRYWKIPDRDPASRWSSEQAVDVLGEELEKSVDRRLLSDVKLGCQLSGGVDSSLINVLAATASGADMDAISIIFEDSRYSEEKWMDAAAARAGVKIHKFVLDDDYFFDQLENAAWFMDQPLNHPNSIGIYYIAQQAKPIVTVLLSGEGADELLGGYPRFCYAGFRPRIRPLLPLLRRLPAVGEKVWRRFGYAEGLDGVDWFMASSAYMTPEDLTALRPGAKVADVLARRRPIFEEGSGDHIANCLRYELRTYLVDLLVRQDKMTMAHSVENRVPFLDHELVETVRQLPSNLLVQPSSGLGNRASRSTKILLKRLARRTFDEDFVYRPKEGFALPLRSFFSDPRFRALMEEAILPGIRSRGVVDAARVEGWWRGLDQLAPAQVEALWIVAAFELWARALIDRRSSPVRKAS